VPTYHPLYSFSFPRCAGVSAPSVQDLLQHPPPMDFGLGALGPRDALATDVGHIVMYESDAAPPHPERRMLPEGRLVAYRGGFLFLPNTHAALLRSVGKEMAEVMENYAKYLSGDFDLKGMFMEGTDGEIADAFSKLTEFVGDLIGEFRKAADEAAGRRQIPASIKSSLAKKDAMMMPYTELVELKIIDAQPTNLWSSVFFGRRNLLCLVFQNDAGVRRAFNIGLRADEDGYEPFKYKGAFHPGSRRRPREEYESGRLDWREATATVLADARVRSDIDSLWRIVERECLSAEFLARLRQKALSLSDPQLMSQDILTDVAAERKRNGTTNAVVAARVLARLGPAADAFAKVPYTKHGEFDPIAKLRAEAAAR
jgi:hypothetical protein